VCVVPEETTVTELRSNIQDVGGYLSEGVTDR
jgi:hypothetical protein